jgi:hypothetical protein
MKKADLERRITEIVKRLSEISEQDKVIILVPNGTPIPYGELQAYADRFDERQNLYGELARLASELIE